MRTLTVYGRKWSACNVKLTNYMNLPSGEGVYLIRIKGKYKKLWSVIYAGQSTVFGHRMKSHSVLRNTLKQVKDYQTEDRVQILFYKKLQEEDLNDLEFRLIMQFRPMFNYIEQVRRYGKEYDLNHSGNNVYNWLKIPFHGNI